MSEEMAVTDKNGDDAKINGEEGAETPVGAEEAAAEPPTQPPEDKPEEPAPGTADAEPEPIPEAAEPEAEENTRRKRRASSAFSDPEAYEDFRGFNDSQLDDSVVGFNRVLERIEAEVSAASENLTPVRNIVATPTAASRINKRLRKDTGTDGSRPSSALSSRSEGDGILSSTDVPSSAASSPANRGRRATTEMSSPLLRVPLEAGWKRELVFRAALDPHSKRNADIYYYTPQGKKLRSTREVAEHLCGTGLTLENFSFFKEPLGIDDPEKEIIRDAKLMSRRVESPVAALAQAAAEGKRVPKPKPPRGSPEPTPKSPPAKIKVKSLGSRLSNSGTSAPSPAQKKKPAAATDNNNSAAWKKPRQVEGAPAAAAAPLVAWEPAVQEPPQSPSPETSPVPSPSPPPTLPCPLPDPVTPPPQSKPPPEPETPPRRLLPPCSMSCGGGRVPTLACASCLCLYHAPCAGVTGTPPPTFLCLNCRTSPPSSLGSPPPLPPQSGVLPPGAGGVAAPAARAPPPPEKRVLLRMKMSGAGAGGERTWSVAPPAAAARAALPQSLAVLGGRRFIVVPRSLLNAQPH